MSLAPHPRVAVVGGGMAGMACALTLAGAGARVTVFEAAPALGGRFGTRGTFAVEAHGKTYTFPVEHGLHGIWRQYHNLRRLLATHGLAARLEDAGEQSLVFTDDGGRPQAAGIGLPVRHSRLPHLVSQLAIFGHAGLRRAVLSEGPTALAGALWDLCHALAFRSVDDAHAGVGRRAVHTKGLSAYDDVPVADFLAEWPPVLQRMFNALTHSAFFREPREVSLAAFLTGLEIYVVRDRRNCGFDVALDDPETAVFGPLSAALRGAGGEVRCGTPVIGLRLEGGRAKGVELPEGGFEPADAIAVAVDTAAFDRLGLGEALGVTLGTASMGAPSVVVRLVFDRALGLRPDRPASGVFADGEVDNFFWLDRLQRPFRAFADETGGSALECHLYGDRAARARDATDEEILARVSRTVEATWPNLLGRRLGAHVQRNAADHTTFPPGTFSRLPGVATAVPNVALCGDWIAVPDCALYLERATVTGLTAARTLAPVIGLDDRWMPAPLAVDPPQPSVRAAQLALRLMRRNGLLSGLARA
ncbi:FAD-dependent oxidoreductase [Myxococcota bacterium]|nr:FAD-dependent oxidoreductase [Myxococcota bacterium]